MEIKDLQKKVDNNMDVRDYVEEYLRKNFDRLQYSASPQALTIRAPRNSNQTVLEASFMSHEGSICRNTIVRVSGTNPEDFKEVEIMVNKDLWDEMRARYERSRASWKSLS